MRKEAVRKIILEFLEDDYMHGYRIYKNLAASGCDVELGYLYELLSEMEKEGVIKSRRERSSRGPPRRVYSLTDKGREELRSHLRMEMEDLLARFFRRNLIKEGFIRPEGRVAVLLSAAPSTFRDEVLIKHMLERTELVYYIRKERNHSFTHGKVRSMAFLGDRIPLDDSSVDYVLLMDMNRMGPSIYDEIYRVLRSGGKFEGITLFWSGVIKKSIVLRYLAEILEKDKCFSILDTKKVKENLKKFSKVELNKFDEILVVRAVK